MIYSICILFPTIYKIAGKIGGRMIEVDSALKKLKEAVEEDQLSSIEAPQDCCMDGEYKGNLRFRTDVRNSFTFTR